MSMFLSVFDQDTETQVAPGVRELVNERQKSASSVKVEKHYISTVRLT